MEAKQPLWKYEKSFGWVYVCPICKRVVCNGPCPGCGQAIDWSNSENRKEFKGKIRKEE